MFCVIQLLTLDTMSHRLESLQAILKTSHYSSRFHSLGPLLQLNMHVQISVKHAVFDCNGNLQTLHGT